MSEPMLLVTLPFLAGLLAAACPRGAAPVGVTATIVNAGIAAFLVRRLLDEGGPRSLSAAGRHRSGSPSSSTGRPL